MAEPARKLDHETPQLGTVPAAEVRRGHILPMRRRDAAEPTSQDWVLEQIVHWYQTRRD